VTQEVDSEQFYLIGKNLFDSAKSLYEAFNVNVSALGETGAMAGSDDAGTALRGHSPTTSGPRRCWARSTISLSRWRITAAS
jgi:hypothetical protein